MGKAAIFIIVFGGTATWLVFWFLRGEAFLLELMTEQANAQYRERGLNARFQTVLRTKPRLSSLKDAGWDLGISDPPVSNKPITFQLQKNGSSWVLTHCRLIPREKGCRCEGITFNTGKDKARKTYQIPILVPSENATTVMPQFGNHRLVTLKPKAEKKWRSLSLEQQLNLVETRLGAVDSLAQNGWRIAINDWQKKPAHFQPLFSLEKNGLGLSECGFQNYGKEVACKQIQWGNRRIMLPTHLTDLKKGAFFTPWERPFIAFLETEAKARFRSFDTHQRFRLIGTYLPQLKKMAATWNPKVTGFDEEKGMIIADLALGKARLTTCMLNLSGPTKTAQCEKLLYKIPGNDHTQMKEIRVPLMLADLNKWQAVSKPNSVLKLENLGTSTLSGTLAINHRDIRVEQPKLRLPSPQASPPQKAVLDLEPFSLTQSARVQSKQPWSFNWLSQWEPFIRDYLNYNGPAAQLTLNLALDPAFPEQGLFLRGSGIFFGQQAVPVEGSYFPGETLALNLEKLQFSSLTGEVCAWLEPAWIEQDIAGRRLRVMGTTLVKDKDDLFCERESNQGSKFAERVGKNLLYGTLLKKARRELSSDKDLSLGVHLLFDPGTGLFCSRLAAKGKAMLDVTTGMAVPFRMTAPYRWQTENRHWHGSPETIKSFVKQALAKGMHFPKVNFPHSHETDPGPITQGWRIAIPSHTQDQAH